MVLANDSCVGIWRFGGGHISALAGCSITIGVDIEKYRTMEQHIDGKSHHQILSIFDHG